MVQDDQGEMSSVPLGMVTEGRPKVLNTNVSDLAHAAWMEYANLTCGADYGTVIEAIGLHLAAGETLSDIDHEVIAAEARQFKYERNRRPK